MKRMVFGKQEAGTNSSQAKFKRWIVIDYFRLPFYSEEFLE